MIDVALAIEALVPAALYGGSVAKNTRKEFESIVWKDKRSKPTWNELEVVSVVEVRASVDVASRLAAIEERLTKAGL